MPEIAVVTGGASGVGAATATHLATVGFAVAVVDIDVAGAQAVVDHITLGGGSAQAFLMDVTDDDAIVRASDDIRRAMATPKVLVNCAGWDQIRRFIDTEPEFWDRVLQVNLRGPIAVTHALLQDVIDNQGRIVNVASDAGRVGSSGEAVYSAAKAGVIGFTKSLAREVARDQVAVNCVCPGPVDTPFLRDHPPKLMEAMVRAIPMGRIAEPNDVVSAIAFFASERAAYITGQVLSVSGGLTMSG